MLRNLFLFLPDEVLPLILVLLVVAVVAGLARSRMLFGFVLFILLMPLIGQLVDTFLNAVPLWLFMLVVGGLVMWVVRAALSIFIGSEAAGHAIGSLAADVIRMMFKMVLLPFRLIGWLLRRRRA